MEDFSTIKLANNLQPETSESTGSAEFQDREYASL
jgi:hypothetical protein